MKTNDHILISEAEAAEVIGALEENSQIRLTLGDRTGGVAAGELAITLQHRLTAEPKHIDDAFAKAKQATRTFTVEEVHALVNAIQLAQAHYRDLGNTEAHNFYNQILVGWTEA